MKIYRFNVYGYPVILPEEGIRVLEEFRTWKIRTWMEYFRKIGTYIFPYYTREMGRMEDVASELYRLYLEGMYEVEEIITVYRTSAIQGKDTQFRGRLTEVEYRVWIYHDKPDEYSEYDCYDMLDELMDIVPPAASILWEVGFEPSHPVEIEEIKPPDAVKYKWYGYVRYEKTWKSELNWWLLERNGMFRIVKRGKDIIPPEPKEIQRWKWW